MKSRTIVISIAIHVVVFALALTVSKSRAARRATSVAIVGEKKKAEPKKEQPKPKPKPLVASARPQAAPAPSSAPRPAPAPAPETSSAPPPSVPETYGNDLPDSIPIGPPVPKQDKSEIKNAQKQTGPALKKEKVLAPKVSDNPEEDTCTEAPSKPVPMQRPSEIEYTQEARASGVEGRLVLRVVVAADGSVTSVDVVSGVDAQLDAAAIAAVKTWVFKPAVRCGKPVGGVAFTIARRFELGD
jgi:periplasmic protein TonB